MLVKDLIVKLGQLNPNLEVWVSRDSEGNAFNYLGFVETSAFSLSDLEAIHPDDVDEYAPGELEEVVILWP
jgi:hypothetical protein